MSRFLAAGTLAVAGVAALPLAALLITRAPWPYLAWVGVAFVVWALNSRVPRVWGRVALLALPLSLFWLGVSQQWLWALALVLGPALARSGGAMLRLGAGLGPSVEMRIPLRSGSVLLVQADRLVLRSVGTRPHAMWLRDLTVVQPGGVAKVTRWSLPGGTRNRIAGPSLLRLVAPPQQWILPVDDAAKVAALVRSRPGTTTSAPLSMQEWRAQQSWAAPRTWQLVAAAVAGSFGWMFVAIGLPVGAAIGLGLALALVGDWRRVRQRMRVAEHNVLPPGSPAWGELRADHAPVAGWQPYGAQSPCQGTPWTRSV